MRYLSLLNMAALSLLILATAGCATISDDTSRFFSQNVEKQHEEFATLPIERQFEIFEAALHAWHPPHTRFGIDLARHGEAAVPHLLKKLQEERWDYTKERIVFVFRLMADVYDVPLNQNDEVMLALEEAVASIADSAYRKQGLYSLSLIAKGEALAD